MTPLVERAGPNRSSHPNPVRYITQIPQLQPGGRLAHCEAGRLHPPIGYPAGIQTGVIIAVVLRNSPNRSGNRYAEVRKCTARFLPGPFSRISPDRALAHTHPQRLADLSPAPARSRHSHPSLHFTRRHHAATPGHRCRGPMNAYGGGPTPDTPPAADSGSETFAGASRDTPPASRSPHPASPPAPPSAGNSPPPGYPATAAHSAPR
jgi:hypothetical protein